MTQKNPARKPAGQRGGAAATGVSPTTDRPSTPARGNATGYPVRHPYGMAPDERLERLAMTCWPPAVVAAGWGVSEAVLASWIAGTAKPRPGFLRWLWRMSNVVATCWPGNHPPWLKPPAVRWADMAVPLEPAPKGRPIGGGKRRRTAGVPGSESGPGERLRS